MIAAIDTSETFINHTLNDRFWPEAEIGKLNKKQ